MSKVGFPYLAGCSLVAGLLLTSVAGEVTGYIQAKRSETELEDLKADEFKIPAFVEEGFELDGAQMQIYELDESGEIREATPDDETLEAEGDTSLENKISSELLDEGYQFENIDFDNLEEANPDIDAWIKIDGTNIDLPIMHVNPEEKDANYYSRRNFNGEDSRTGVPYLYADNNSLSGEDISDVSLVFGHNVYRGMAFSELPDYMNQSFYDEHPFGVVYTADGYAYKLSFFAGMVTSGNGENTEVYKDKFENEESFNLFVENAIGKSTFKSDVEPEFGDDIMVLCTCEYSGDNQRYVLFGVLDKQYIKEEQIDNDINDVNRLIR